MLSWLAGNPRRFKTFVGNRVSEIVDHLPPECWRHVASEENPADCASRGIFPAELLQHKLWWEGPPWLLKEPAEWPCSPDPVSDSPVAASELCLASIVEPTPLVIAADKFSSFTKLKRVVAWIKRFISRCKKTPSSPPSTVLSVPELNDAEVYILQHIQAECFAEELASITSNHAMPRKSNLKSLLPFRDPEGLLRVGGRLSHSNIPASMQHPIILSGKHVLVRRLIRDEHLRLLHAGPSLVYTSLLSRSILHRRRQKGCSLCHP